MPNDTRSGRRGNRPLEVRMPETERHLDAAIAANAGTTVPDVVREFLRWWRGEPGATCPVRPDITRDDLKPSTVNEG